MNTKLKKIISIMLIMILILNLGLTFADETSPTIDIEKEKELFEQKMKTLTNEILKKYKDTSGVGFYIQELNTGFEYGYNDKKVEFNSKSNEQTGGYTAASVAKLPLAFAMFKLAEEELFDINKIYVDKVTNRKINFKTDLAKMNAISSNELHNSFVRIANQEGYHKFNKTSNKFESEINRVLEDYGFSNLKLYGEIGPAAGWSAQNNVNRYGIALSGRINPYEIGKLLEYIYKNKDSSPNMKLLNQGLLDNIYFSRIPTGINFKYPVAHKTGTYPGAGVYNDAGIVYLNNNPYVFVFFTQNETESRAHKIVREVAKEVMKTLETRTDISIAIKTEIEKEVIVYKFENVRDLLIKTVK